ncbi:MAG: DNA translocase FtsK 4TM domain-containing protein [Campylobacter sp.]
MFFGVATIAPNADFVGSFGKILGDGNFWLFGFLGYAYPFGLIFVAYYFYKYFKKPTWEFAQISFGIILLFFAILLFQANASMQYGGLIGNSGISALKDLIGVIGTWFFIVVLFIVSFGLVAQERIDIIIKKAFVEPNLKQARQDTQKENLQKADVEIKSKISPKSPIDEEIQIANLEEIRSDVDLNETKDVKFIVEEVQPKFKIQENQDSQEAQDDFEALKKIDIKKQDVTPKINKVEILNEVAENKKLLEEIEQGRVEKPKGFELPSLDFLANPPKRLSFVNEEEIDRKISDLLDKLRKFKIDGDVVRTYTGPIVTTFEFRPAPHIKVSKILTLQDDLAMALRAQTIRIQAPIPGKDVVGIEVPNQNLETIYLKEILESEIYKNASSPLTMALGKDIVGAPFITDLKKLPHLLIAGTTGSGKSVGINAMLLSLLYRNSPKTLRLMMIDPKMLEFSIYNDIPHLLTPVITQAKQAITALSNMVAEMERRYAIMSHARVKNIESYNEKMKSEGGEQFPYIVVIIDELADLMMTSGKDVELYIGRLAQMARASGIHLIVATQRPSVDVVTGLIKANLPSRISYRVGQRIDSKVILDQMGAESLLGRGDMLFTPPGSPGVIRLHAPFASEQEIENIVEFLKAQQEVVYDERFLAEDSGSASGASVGLNTGELDELYEEAKEIILSEQKTSISYLQRRLKIGYNRAATIIEQMEQMGVLSPMNAKGQRDIL